MMELIYYPVAGLMIVVSMWFIWLPPLLDWYEKRRRERRDFR